MSEKVIIPANTVRNLINSFIKDELKTTKFKWVMKKQWSTRLEYTPIGAIEVMVEE